MVKLSLWQPGRVGIAHHFIPHTRCWGIF